MSSVEIFNSIYNPLCAAMAGVFNQLSLGLGTGFDFNQICTGVGDVFRSLLANLPF